MEDNQELSCLSKKKGEAIPLSPRLHQFVSLFRAVTPDRCRLLNRCALRIKRIVGYGLLQTLLR